MKWIRCRKHSPCHGEERDCVTWYSEDGRWFVEMWMLFEVTPKLAVHTYEGSSNTDAAKHVDSDPVFVDPKEGS